MPRGQGRGGSTAIARRRGTNTARGRGSSQPLSSSASNGVINAFVRVM